MGVIVLVCKIYVYLDLFAIGFLINLVSFMKEIQALKFILSVTNNLV
jgi:hypothetical protein